MATDQPQSSEDLHRHLKEQINFLETSAKSYDEGYDAEAKRLAVTLRVLLHDTARSKSLLGLLGLKGGLFFDSAQPADPSSSSLSYHGLISICCNGVETKYVPFLDDLPHRVGKEVDFDSWWDTVIFIDQKGQKFSRKELILSIANKDGGAHIDPTLNEKYADLSRQNSLGWYSVKNEATTPLEGAEKAAIRQIAHEALKSLKCNYKKNLVMPGSGIMVAGVQIGYADSPSHEKIGRNDPCPCGSGKKYKKCCRK